MQRFEWADVSGPGATIWDAAALDEVSEDRIWPGTVGVSMDTGSNGVMLWGSPEALADWAEDVARRLRAEHCTATVAAPEPEPTDAVRDDAFVTAWLRPGSELLSGGEVPSGKFGLRLVGDYELYADAEQVAEFGEKVAARYDGRRWRSVGDLAELIEQVEPGMGLNMSWQCSEVDALVRVLAAHGQHDAAVNLIRCHADGDGEAEDLHAHIRDMGEDSDQAADLYVRELMGD